MGIVCPKGKFKSQVKHTSTRIGQTKPVEIIIVKDLLGIEETIMIYESFLAERFWIRVSREVAVKMSAGATVFEDLSGARESSSKIAVGRSPLFHTMWASS